MKTAPGERELQPKAPVRVGDGPAESRLKVLDPSLQGRVVDVCALRCRPKAGVGGDLVQGLEHLGSDGADPFQLVDGHVGLETLVPLR